MCRSTDRNFVYDWVGNRYRDRIQRAAVLYAIFGRPARTTAQVISLTKATTRRWRARLAVLMQAGWQPRPQGYNTFLRNCCPTFAHAQPRMAPCRLEYICPFCYARWVAEVWETIDAAFPNPREVESEAQIARGPMDDLLEGEAQPAEEPGADEHEGRPLRSIRLDTELAPSVFPFHLVSRVAKSTIGLLPTGDELGNYPTHSAYCRYLLDRESYLRGMSMRTRMRSGDIHGAFCFTTLTPCEEGWQLIARQLFMINADAEDPFPAGPGVHRYDRPTRKRIYRAVTQVCRYPTQLMEADPALTAATLIARRPRPIGQRSVRGPRMSAMYGAFRNRRNFG